MAKSDESIHYLLTAAHCSDWTNGYNSYRVPDNAYIGETQSIQNLYGSNGLDAALIRLNGTFSGGTAFAADSLFTAKNLVGSATHVVGEWDLIPRDLALCVSGSFVNQTCNFERPTGTHGDFMLRVIQGIPVKNVGVVRTNSNAPWGPGDSGGPIYRHGPMVNRVTLYGITSASDATYG